MTFTKKAVIGSLVGAGMLASPAAMAGWSGNVGAISEYNFRGVSQGGSAAVQGGVDYGHDSTGIYAGLWASNVGFGSGDGNGGEVDLYTGWAGEFGGLGVDLGVLYYLYPEEDETTNAQGQPELSTLEFYGGLSYGIVGFNIAYSEECKFFGTEGNVFTDANGAVVGDTSGDAQEALYLSLGVDLPLSDSVSLSLSVGQYSGDEIERFLLSIGSNDDDYIDYSIGINKSLDGGMGFSLTLIDTDIETAGSNIEDEPAFVVGFSKEFDL